MVFTTEGFLEAAIESRSEWVLYICVYICVYVFACLNMKISNQNLFKKRLFYIKPVIFWFVQKPSQDCALNKRCRNYIYLNISKNTKEQLKVG